MPATTKLFTNTTKRFIKNNNSPTSLPPSKPNPSSLKEITPTSPPPTPICAGVNSQIRQNPALHYPEFDFASYVRHRTYTLSTIDFGKTATACFVDKGVHDIIEELLFEMSLPTPPTVPSYEIRDAREKGLGIFATTPIPRNGTILTEHPTIIAPYLLGLSVPLAEMYTELFESLPKRSFALATSLLTKHQDDLRMKSPSEKPSSLPPPSFYEDIMQTNSIAVDLFVPSDAPYHEITTHRALFLLLSRCNHSCNPNAVWSWDAVTLTLTLTALRRISPGEEVTISYIPLSRDHTVRQEALMDTFGFNCSCEECTLPPYELRGRNVVMVGGSETLGNEMSAGDDSDDSDCDENTTTTRGALPTFEEWCADPRLPDDILIKAHKSALYHLEQQDLEGLQSTHLGIPHLPKIPLGDLDDEHEMRKHWQTQAMCASLGSGSTRTIAQAVDHHVEAIAMCYGALEDVTNFRSWISIAKEARVSKGARSEEKIVFNKWLSNPACFPMWGWRK